MVHSINISNFKVLHDDDTTMSFEIKAGQSLYKLQSQNELMFSCSITKCELVMCKRVYKFMFSNQYSVTKPSLYLGSIWEFNYTKLVVDGVGCFLMAICHRKSLYYLLHSVA